MKKNREQLEKMKAKLLTVLHESEILSLFNEMDLRQFKKGMILLKHGEPCNQIFFILSGGLRMWQIGTDGTDHTVELFAPSSFAVDYYSFIRQVKSDMTIEAVHNSVVLSLEHSHLEQLYKSQPVFERISRLLTQQAYLDTIQRFRRDLTKSPQANYEMTLKLRPELFECFPQYMIASYLGVGPEWLSRIRAKNVTAPNLLT